MARYKKDYSGEKRSEKVTVQLTATERDLLEKAAEGEGAATLSAYARDRLFRGLTGLIAPSRRNPDAADLMRALTAAGRELNATGNNLNQIARHLNATGELREWPELREALQDFQQIAGHLKDAVSRVLDL